MGITISDLGELLEFRGVGRVIPQRPKGNLNVPPRAISLRQWSQPALPVEALCKVEGGW